MNTLPIRNDTEYEAALARAEALMDAEYGTPEGAELNTLADRIVAYEHKRFNIDTWSAKPIKKTA
jgi:HTH-type transcriptional regulator/antitoxin HigA